MKFKAVLLLILCIFILPLKSNAQQYKQITQLAGSEQWRALLHINMQSQDNVLESYVDDDTFFLATDGATHPINELLATISSLKSTPENTV